MVHLLLICFAPAAPEVSSSLVKSAVPCIIFMALSNVLHIMHTPHNILCRLHYEINTGKSMVRKNDIGMGLLVWSLYALSCLHLVPMVIGTTIPTSLYILLFSTCLCTPPSLCWPPPAPPLLPLPHWLPHGV